jgi:hypothetical protein
MLEEIDSGSKKMRERHAAKKQQLKLKIDGLQGRGQKMAGKKAEHEIEPWPGWE